MKRLLIIIAATGLLASCTAASPGTEESSSSSRQATAPSEATSMTQQTSDHDPTTGFAYPLSDATERMTKKFFGTYVTPKNSPVQPERFTGYHTGTDFETFPTEQNMTVTAHAICDGTVVYRGWVSGYGGVLIQSCTYKNQPVTVLYGHLNIDTIMKNKNDAVTTGDAIGDLGQGYSHQTDGERKHLHVSVHRGSSVDFKGYVSSKDQLSQWIDAFPTH